MSIVFQDRDIITMRLVGFWVPADTVQISWDFFLKKTEEELHEIKLKNS